MRSASTMSKAFLGGGFVLFLTFALASHAAAQTCVQPPLGLVHWWPGDGDATDIVGGSTGMLEGGASFVTGLVAQAFGFDGLNGSVATPVILPPVGTIELWVNPTSLDSPSSTQILTGTHGTANGNDRLWIVSVGSGGGPGVAPNTFVVNVGSCCVNDIVLFTNPLSVGTWTHIALTFDYTLGVYRLYVDGVLEASATAPRNAPTQAFRLGGATSDFGQNFFFHGAVDEVSVYDRVLAASEIQAIVSAGSAGKCEVTTVAVDIKPGSLPNSINPKSKGKLPVAILTTNAFDATTVDPTTVRFGQTGTEAAPVQSALEDVDGDGDTDMILHFNTQDTGIVCGDTSASLTGETFGGQAIQGTDAIKTVACK
jgi:concanavalin A-like lectin/glucanase superfamily protein